MARPPISYNEADPIHWLGNTAMLNLGDDKLRLRVKTVIQFSRTDPERLQCVARYVAAIPFNVPAFAGMKRTRKTLRQRRAVGWYSKAALFMAMLRVAGVPARVRMIRVPPELFRGLVNTRFRVELPVVEVWIQHRWVATDSYLYDPSYLATAREALAERNWPMGFGIHRNGQSDWNGVDEALVMIIPDRSRSERPAQYLGVYDDPQAFAAQMRRRTFFRWWFTLVRNRLLSIRMNLSIRRLRREAGG
ncbi:MAG: transglutaminase domain-containing protein [Ramlibacter sp.]|nr:transglutaminase domain-containing protein [Ramlibacter sp.]